MSEFVTVSHGSMEVTSNTSTEEQIREALEFPTAADEASEAAAKLGKRGGKAAAEARKSKQDEEPPSDVADKGAKAPEKKETKPEPKDEEKPETKKGNPRHDPEARKAEIAAEIRELTERKKAAERAADDAERRRQSAERPPQPAKEEKPADGKPDWSRYEADGRSFQEFLDDSNSHAVKEGIKKYESERQAREKREAEREAEVGEFRQFVSTYEQRMNDYAEKNGGQEFLDSLDPELLSIPPRRALNGGPVRPENFIVEEILSSESPAQLWAHFSANRQEFQRLATLPPLEIIRGIAKLEASLLGSRAAATAGNSAPRAPEVSQAKPPVRPVTGAPHTADDDDDLDALAKLPLNKYVAVMNAKERRAQR